MSDYDCYALAVELLEGDYESRTILADLLEERGERKLAQHARHQCLTDRSRVELSVMLLPWQAAIGLGIEYFEAAYDISDWHQARRWLAGETQHQEMVYILQGPLAEVALANAPHVRAKMRDWSWSKVQGAQRVHEALHAAAYQIAFCPAQQFRPFREIVARRQICKVVARTWERLSRSKHLKYWAIQRVVEALHKSMQLVSST